MKTFTQFINQEINLSEASIRQGLPHITTMSHDQFHNLIDSGKIHLHDMTEKTDGQTHVMGYDKYGFYTQSSGSGSEKMRKPEDFAIRAKRRASETGKEYDPTSSNAFGHIHSLLQNNKKLQKYLEAKHQKTGEDVKVRGEVFYKPWGREGDKPGETKFVGTSYATDHMGKVGKYVIHSKLPENQNHDIEHFKKHLSDDNINFDDDKIDHIPSHVDVHDEKRHFSTLNHDLINSRTTIKNKESKTKELEKLKEIQKKVSDKVDKHIGSLGLKPKWGSGSEGIVVHPHNNQPRFKVTSDAFRKFKNSDDSKNFMKRDVKEFLSFKSFKQVILEGGNIKIGEYTADNIHVTPENRSAHQQNIHNMLSDLHDSFHKETGKHLFGIDKKSLKTGSAYSGSTKHLMNNDISHNEFVKYKATVGDVDVQIPKEHSESLLNHLQPNKKFGTYIVVGTKKGGNETHVLMKHDSGPIHQFDFEHTNYHNGEPEKFDRFSHSSDWNDTKSGIKGAHHKILLNAVGTNKYKFSPKDGLGNREGEANWKRNTKDITHTLFGKNSEENYIHSFKGITNLIKTHIPKEHHQEIYDKFKNSVKSMKKLNSDPAISHLRKELNTND